jgi:hypothetical protein
MRTTIAMPIGRYILDQSGNIAVYRRSLLWER